MIIAKRVALLTEIISPYRIPVLNELAADRRIELDVFFFAETESRRRWRVTWEQIRFQYRVLPGFLVAHRYQHGPIFLNPGILVALWRGKYQTVIFFGYHHPTIWIALLWCRLSGVRALLWSESTLMDSRSTGRVIEWIKRRIVRLCDGFVAAGKAQVDYLKYLGAPADQIWIAPDAVDSDFFTNQSQVFKNRRKEIKQALNVDGPIILYVGRLLDAKGVPDLLAAFERITAQTGATLFLVGDGPKLDRYQEICRVRKLTSVRFEGFRPQEELPKYYGIADLLVFPTRSDPWGLVLNEAMCAGLPVVASSAAGATADLVHPGQNGFVHDPEDVDMIARHMLTLLSNDDLRRRMGNASRKIIGDFSPQKMAQGFVEAIHNSSNRENAAA